MSFLFPLHQCFFEFHISFCNKYSYYSTSKFKCTLNELFKNEWKNIIPAIFKRAIFSEMMLNSWFCLFKWQVYVINCHDSREFTRDRPARDHKELEHDFSISFNKITCIVEQQMPYQDRYLCQLSLRLVAPCSVSLFC